MYLTELHIHGFKSFARRTDLNFPTAVTAIVGPNGSGKSNVAEALRFVLGEQSVKSMRGKKSEDLIWGGSDTLARSNRASVSLKLNNQSRILSLDVDSITIERAVHRDGQSEYKINEQSVRLKDVHELLAAGNIGPSGHHIISQGEADRVLAATPQERRAMIEEALGLKVYQYKKTDAEKKLGKTQQNISEVHNLRKEIAPHLKYLERELQKVAQARELQSKLKTFYSEYLRREDCYLANEYERVSVKQQEYKRELDTANKKIEELQDHVVEQNNGTEQTDEAERTALRAAVEQQRLAEEAANQTKGHLLALEEQIAAHNEVDNGVQVALADIEEEWSFLTKKAEAQTDVSSVSAMQKAYETLRDGFGRWLQNAKGIVHSPDTGLLERRTNLQAELASKQSLVQEAQTLRQNAETTLEAVQKAARHAQREREIATKSLYEAKTATSNLQAAIDRCTHELTLIERERQVFKDDLQEAVALLGRGAAEYFSYKVIDESGNELSVESIATEPRSIQRERKRELERMKIRLETLGEGVSTDLEKEYEETKARDEFLASEIADLESSVETLQILIEDLKLQIDAQFQEGFARIQTEFQNFFALMFGGGTAKLELITPTKSHNSEDDGEVESENAPLPSGIELALTLPNKRISGLAMLSGGERALTSTALIFAMSQVHPPLFVVLDETDAALDEANSRRYGDLIEALAKRSQLILITHNRETMSRADTLYGVTMGDTGMSQLLSVQFADAALNAKA